MNILLFTIQQSLKDLMAGLLGQLNMTEDMETLANNLFLNTVPALWTKYAYFSLKDLSTWYNDLNRRCAQLDIYSESMIPPVVLWISGLFNPMSFITAIKQITARETGSSLDDQALKTDIMNHLNPDELTEKPSTGAYIHGFFLEGAGWEMGRGAEQGYLTDMVLKELSPVLPVMHVSSILSGDVVKEGKYRCPCYCTTMRGGHFVFECLLNMESEETDPKMWILAGVALMLQPE